MYSSSCSACACWEGGKREGGGEGGMGGGKGEGRRVGRGRVQLWSKQKKILAN